MIRLGQDRVGAVQVGREDGLQCKQGAMQHLKDALIHTEGDRTPIHRWQARRRILLAAVEVAGHYVGNIRMFCCAVDQAHNSQNTVGP